MPHEIHEVSVQIVNAFVTPDTKGEAATGMTAGGRGETIKRLKIRY